MEAPQKLPDFWLWEERRKKQGLVSFTLELTPRCNNACRHCYINLPAGDGQARERELDFDGIKKIVDEAAELGAMWCLITGGEPLLREDFEDIYLYIKRKGIFVSVFTNATLISEKHVQLFKKYPPRALEITVYGVTEKTYGAVTGKPELFAAFMRGVRLLLDAGVPLSLKTVMIRSNVHEFQEIAAFCRAHSSEPFRFDPFIHLRFDRDEKRNQEIREERLSPEAIVALEHSDSARHDALQKNCEKLVFNEDMDNPEGFLFGCGAGISEFYVNHEGFFMLCASLYGSGLLYDLKNGTIKNALDDFVPKIRAMRTTKTEYMANCGRCRIINLCLWCPAHAFLEMGQLDACVDYFCSVAKERYKKMLL